MNRTKLSYIKKEKSYPEGGGERGWRRWLKRKRENKKGERENEDLTADAMPQWEKSLRKVLLCFNFMSFLTSPQNI